MIRIPQLITTNEHTYTDLLFDGTAEDLFAEAASGDVPIEFIYQKEDGKFATLFLANAIIEAIYLDKLATHLERIEVQDDDDGAYSIYSPKDFSDEEIAAIKNNCVSSIASIVLKNFQGELNKINGNALDEIAHITTEACSDTFGFNTEENIERTSLFLTINLPLFIDSSLRNEPDIFLPKNKSKLKKKISKFVEDNKDFSCTLANN